MTAPTMSFKTTVLPTLRTLAVPALLLLAIQRLGAHFSLPMWADAAVIFLACVCGGWCVERTATHWFSASALGGVVVLLPSVLVSLGSILWLQPFIAHAPRPDPDGVAGVFVSVLFFGFPLAALIGALGGAARHFIFRRIHVPSISAG